MATGGRGVGPSQGSPYSSDSESSLNSSTSDLSSRSFSGSSVSRSDTSSTFIGEDFTSDQYRERTGTRAVELVAAMRRMPRATQTSTSSLDSQDSATNEVTKADVKRAKAEEAKRIKELNSRRTKMKKKYKELRSKRREQIIKQADLASPKSKAAEVFKLLAGKPAAETMTEPEARYLTDKIIKHLESDTLDADFDAKMMGTISRVIDKECILADAAPELDKWLRTHSKSSHKRFSVSHLKLNEEMKVPDDKKGLSMVLAGFDKCLENCTATLRVNYLEELLQSGTAEEQLKAYENQRERLIKESETVSTYCTMLNEYSTGVDDKSGLIPCVNQTLKGMEEKLKFQLTVLDSLKKADFRYQRYFVEEAVVLCSATANVLGSKEAKSVTDPEKLACLEQLRVLAEQTGISLPKNLDELRPRIVADLMELQKQFKKLAKGAGLKHQFDRVLTDHRMAGNWPELVEDIPVRTGLKTQLFRSTNTPHETIVGEVGAVPSTAQDVTHKPCNGWVHSLSPVDGEGRLNKCYRSAVPTPYKVKNTEQRMQGAEKRSEKQLLDSLLMEFDGDADKLEAFCGTPENAAECPMLGISYLTMDWIRNATGIHDDELGMAQDAASGFNKLVTSNTEIKPLTFIDKEGKARSIFLKPEMAMISCGCNDLALSGLKYFTFPWGPADAFNQDSIETMTGSDVPEDPIEGWVGTSLDHYRTKYDRPHPNEKDVRKKVEEWRAMMLLEEHHSAHADSFKAANYPGHIAAMLREDHPTVLKDLTAMKAERQRREQAGEPVAELGNVPRRFPIQVFAFCKSGKDRTGAGMASLDRVVAEHYMDGLTTVSEPVINKDRMNNAQNFAIVIQAYLQWLNGAMGSKTNGEDNLLGKVVCKARKHSKDSPVIDPLAEASGGKKPKKKSRAKK